MRWEDDGGPAADIGGPGSQGAPARLRSANTKESSVSIAEHDPDAS
jgi:hypothetical protein